MRIVRTGNQTTVYFESIAVIFNNTKDDLLLEPFYPAEKPRVIQRKDCLKLPGNKVTVIPLTWFEKCYQVLVSTIKPNTLQTEQNSDSLAKSN